MKKLTSRLGAVLLAVMLLCSVSVSSAADTYTAIEAVDGVYRGVTLEAETTTVETTEIDPETGMARVVFERTFPDVRVFVSRSSYIDCDITITMIENLNNTSGFEITGVKSVSVTGFDGWYMVRNARVADTTYGDGRQTVIVEITFSSQLNIGDPWLTQTGSTTLSIL